MEMKINGLKSVSITGPEHAEDRKWLTEQQIPVFAYSSMSGGFISGEFKSNDREAAAAFLSEPTKKGYWADENFERLARAEQLAKERGVSVATIAMAWLFNQELKVIPIQGGQVPGFFSQNLKAADFKLTEREVRWLNLEV